MELDAVIATLSPCPTILVEMNTILGVSQSKLIKKSQFDDVSVTGEQSDVTYRALHAHLFTTHRVLFIKKSNMNAITPHTGARGQDKGLFWINASST